LTKKIARKDQQDIIAEKSRQDAIQESNYRELFKLLKQDTLSNSTVDKIKQHIDNATLEELSKPEQDSGNTILYYLLQKKDIFYQGPIPILKKLITKGLDIRKPIIAEQKIAALDFAKSQHLKDDVIELLTNTKNKADQIDQNAEANNSVRLDVDASQLNDSDDHAKDIMGKHGDIDSHHE
jgi:hypothetical protein